VSVELDDSYEAIYQRAISQMGFGRTDEAIESLWRIINRLTRLPPQTIQRKENLQRILTATWEGLVQVLRWEGRYDEAISACEKVIDHLSEEDGADRRIGSLLIERGDVEKGLHHLRQIVDEKPSFMSWADLGAEYSALEQHQEAKSCYQAALSLAQSNEAAAVANAGLFRVARETGRVEDALSAWNMIAVLDPDLGDHVSEVYTWLLERGDLERAEKYLNREPDPIYKTFYQGMIDWQSERPDAARSKWRRVLEMELDDDSDATPWIEAALRLGEPQRATEAEEMLLERDSRISADEAVALGIAHAMLDEIEDAKGWFEQVIARLKRGWPVRSKIGAEQWSLLTSVVTDQETVQALADYFDKD
jgi:tetratricopeptide (TPR) repeat protein